VIGWIDAGSGASGDMLLGALLGAGADLARIRDAVHRVAPEDVTLDVAETARAGLAATRAEVRVADSSTHRGLSTVLGLIDAADIGPDVTRHATAVFRLLGEAEAAVHGTSVDEVHFHEVGALDAIADVVGVCAGFVDLGLTAVHCSPVAVGSGTVRTSHGELGVPPPAVVRLLHGIPSYAGHAEVELCTPTGAALLAHWVDAWGPQPPMSTRSVGHGAGGRDLPGRANLLRLLVGDELTPTGTAAPATAVVLETNVDDLDPRLWPRILGLLLENGASDAWLTPILMKKGRPAHTLSVLVRGELAPAVRAVVYAETSAIGMREQTVTKHELARSFESVSVDGRPIRIKVARLGAEVMNRQPEYEDVVAAAIALGRPVKVVLAEALAALTSAQASRSDI
jgi:uncharacterized protein (TIGR00299 family) protein